MKIKFLALVFVESFPASAEEGKIYVSIRFRTAMHLCCCGCRNQVITPIRPNDWTIAYNGESISLTPSIGNWSLACRSHYWINQGNIEEAEDWPQERVDRNREIDLLRKERRHGRPLISDEERSDSGKPSFWRGIIGLVIPGLRRK